MKATLLNHRRFVTFNRSGKPVVFEMKLFRISGKEAVHHPEGYRVGWIAFDPENTHKRVLFDSHSPKGIHFHIDDEDEGTSFIWKSLAKTERIFFEMACRDFNIDEKELP
jgi:hypothetical protein